MNLVDLIIGLKRRTPELTIEQSREIIREDNLNKLRNKYEKYFGDFKFIFTIVNHTITYNQIESNNKLDYEYKRKNLLDLEEKIAFYDNLFDKDEEKEI